MMISRMQKWFIFSLIIFSMSSCEIESRTKGQAATAACGQEIKNVQACDLINAEMARQIMDWPEIKTETYLRMSALDENEEVSGSCKLGTWNNPQTIMDDRFTKEFIFSVHWGANSLTELLEEAAVNSQKAPEDLRIFDELLISVDGPAQKNFHSIRTRSLRMIYDDTLLMAFGDHKAKTGITNVDDWYAKMIELSGAVTLPTACGT